MTQPADKSPAEALNPPEVSSVDVSETRRTFLNCDLSCTGSSHNNVVDCDAEATVIGCRFVGANNSKLSINDGLVERCQFFGGNVGVQVNNWAAPTLFINNRHYRGDRSIGDITRLVNQAQ